MSRSEELARSTDPALRLNHRRRRGDAVTRTQVLGRPGGAIEDGTSVASGFQIAASLMAVRVMDHRTASDSDSKRPGGTSAVCR